jgi:hypothetical protein
MQTAQQDTTTHTGGPQVWRLLLVHWNPGSMSTCFSTINPGHGQHNGGSSYTLCSSASAALSGSM